MKYTHVVGQVVLLGHMHVEAVRHRVEVVAGHAADEAVALHVLLHALQLITKLTKRVDDQTLEGNKFHYLGSVMIAKSR